MALKTDYKDDILDTSVNTKRKYRQIDNEDGTFSLEDETVYKQEGSSFGANDINEINKKINSSINGIELRIENGNLQFRYDKEVYPDA